MTTTATTYDPLLSQSPSSSPGYPGLVSWYAEGLSDPIGDRLQLFDNAGPPMELLRIRPELAAGPGFEAALRQRVSELEGLQHSGLARVRSVTVLDDPAPALALVSELAEGERLSALLRAFEQAGVRPDPSAAIWLLRRLLPALAALHECGPAVSHGLLTPNRVMLGPGGRVVIAECALGSAFATLGLGQDGAWTRFGAFCRSGLVGPAPHRANDVAQAALLATSVLLGRPLRLAEVASIPTLIEDACVAWPESQRMKPWLRRALGPEAPAFESATDALAALEESMRGLLEAWPGRLLPAGAPGGSLAPRGVPGLPAVMSPTAGTSSHAALPVPSESPRLLAGTVEPARRATRWLWVANAGLVTVVLAEAILLLAQFVRGPAQPASTPSPLQPVRPAAAHAAIVPGQSSSTPAGTAAAGTAAKPAARRVGWVLVESRVPVKVSADGILLGRGTSARYRLQPGHHTLSIENPSHGIAFTEPLDLSPGQTVLVSVDAPH